MISICKLLFSFNIMVNNVYKWVKVYCDLNHSLYEQQYKISIESIS